MWRFGAVPNCHVTISFKKMGIVRERKALRLFSNWNMECKRWLSDDELRTQPRKTPRFSFGGCEYYHIYVVEEGTKLGCHVHQLTYIPPHAWNEYQVKIARWFACRLRIAALDSEAIKKLELTALAHEADAVFRAWGWFHLFG